MKTVRFHSLEDFLVSSVLTVDDQLNDGWGQMFPVKGREIDASILFADITGYSRRISSLSAVEALIFTNNFFAWISAEALKNTHGIVDKYIGDELMLVFSKEFGSEDPFIEALQAGRFMSEHDALSFEPHIGIANGRVIVGYVGTSIKYNCSVFGEPVVVASRCAGVRPPIESAGIYSTSITFPTIEWGQRELDNIFPPLIYESSDGKRQHSPQTWVKVDLQKVDLKNIHEIELSALVNRKMWRPMESAEDRAKESLRLITTRGRYWPPK